jgi:hypothetical protein
LLFAADAIRVLSVAVIGTSGGLARSGGLD